MNSNFRNLALWVIIGLLLIALFNLFQSPAQRSGGSEIAFTKFLSEVDEGRVQDVTISGSQIVGRYTNGTGFQTYAPDAPNLVDRLYNKGVQITAKPSSDDVPSLFGILISWFPMLL
ncbi:MAG: ATP-dependent metallopeptidase FtsH/Yme1/Tma family protein, partial [Hyphomicrobiales bacterium]|nr:ATP-dependent metallopeptidase FtsH/Yme1/Tma family protein [Hyphomicrobiales bacterium]